MSVFAVVAGTIIITRLEQITSAAHEAHASRYNGAQIEAPPLNPTIPYCFDVRGV